MPYVVELIISVCARVSAGSNGNSVASISSPMTIDVARRLSVVWVPVMTPSFMDCVQKVALIKGHWLSEIRDVIPKREYSVVSL